MPPKKKKKLKFYIFKFNLFLILFLKCSKFDYTNINLFFYLECKSLIEIFNAVKLVFSDNFHGLCRFPMRNNV